MKVKIKMMDNVDRGKTLVWGNFGKEIKDLDEKRLYAIAQNNPEYYLNLILTEELDIIFDKLLSALDNDEDIDEFLNEIFDSNKKHNLFKEINSFLTQSDDMLSIGSFLTGEFDKSYRVADILSKGD